MFFSSVSVVSFYFIEMDNVLENYYHENFDEFNTHYSDRHLQNLRIMQWNIRGMNELNKFNNVLQALDHCEASIDILVIGETWIKKENVELYNIAGYNKVFACRENFGGGLAMFISKQINYKIVKNETIEGLHHIQLELDLNGQTYDIHGVYRPSSFDFNIFHDLLEGWLCSTVKNRPCFLAGDFNIPMNLLHNNLVFRYKTLLESLGFVCSNTFTTRPASNNILDHLVTRIDDAHRIRNDTIFSDVSNHLQIITSYKLFTPKDRTVLTKKVVNHRRLNEAFTEFLNGINVVDSADEWLSTIITTYNELLSQNTQTFTVSVNLKNTNCPWMSYDLWKLIKIKNNLLNRVKRNPNDVHLKDLLTHMLKKVEHAKK